MADKLAFDLVSPERLLMAAQADMVLLPGGDGDFAVLTGHAPLLSTLRPGMVEIHSGDKVTDRFFVMGGFAEVTPEKLVILAEDATQAADLKRETLEAAIADCEARAADAMDFEEALRFTQKASDLHQVLAQL